MIFQESESVELKVIVVEDIKKAIWFGMQSSRT